MDGGARKRKAGGFEASARWAGARPGWFFGRGAFGMGYYPDHAAATPAAPAAAGAPSPPAPDGAALLAEAEAAAAGGGRAPTLDASWVRSAVVSLEKRVVENLEARAAHAGTPAKWLDSELSLHEDVSRLSSLAAAPELYAEAARLGLVGTLLQLLQHDNADVAAAVAALLKELTEAEDVAATDASLAGAVALGAAVLAGGDGGLGGAGGGEEAAQPEGAVRLAAALARFDEAAPSEAAAVGDLLSTLEAVCETSPALRDAAASSHQLLDWLFARACSRRGDDDVRLAAAELVAALLGSSSPAAAAAARRLASSGAVDSLLSSVAPFRKAAVPPPTAVQVETGENLLDILCCILVAHPPAATALVDAEGIELLLLLIRAKGGPLKTGALRCLDFASTSSPPAAARIVDASGLGAVFAAFGGRSAAAAAKARGADAAGEEERRAIAVVAALLAHCPWDGGGTNGGRRARVVAKFSEDGCSKADRLAELWEKHSARLGETDDALGDADEDDEADTDERVAARLDGGLQQLQHLAATIAALLASQLQPLCSRLIGALALRCVPLASVRGVLAEAAELSRSAGGAAAEAEATRLDDLRAHAYAEGEERTPEREGGGGGGDEAGGLGDEMGDEDIGATKDEGQPGGGHARDSGAA